MRYSTASLVVLVALATRTSQTNAFVSAPSSVTFSRAKPLSASVVASEVEELTYHSVNQLAFRQLQKECKARSLPATGNTASLRTRLLEFHGVCLVDTTVNGDADSEEEVCVPTGISFSDESDADFEFNDLLKTVLQKAEVGHWKAATRKLKQLQKRYESPERLIPDSAFVAVLEACTLDRMHGARAAEPTRKVVEEMAVRGYSIRPELAQLCVTSCIGMGAGGTHDGFGGIDPALAMLAAFEHMPSAHNINVDTYGTVVSALSREGSVEEAVLLLRAMVVEHSFTPVLSVFADVAQAAAKESISEEVLHVLTLAKAAGYELDSIASAEAGRSLLASGVIACEQLDNLALGLRLLTAAGKASGCLPDRGDDLVAAHSSAAQRAATLIHKRAIDKAMEDDNWKVAVKILSLMPERSLTPSTSVWRKVVTICAKCEKSRKATAILLDWIKLSEEGKAEKPPIKVFNTVVNVCEICGEEELTLVVLEAMKKTHETEGNIITFNIALKRLAKLGQARSCEGIIIGMLQAGMEPSVVSYTTAIGACAHEPKDPAYAYEWLKRMASRDVKANFHTYNTALATCLDGKLESTVLASKIATAMLEDVDKELEEGFKGSADYNSVIPDKYSKVLARQLMKQLRDNWRSGDINMQVAKATIRVPLLKLVDFEKSEAATRVKKAVEDAAVTKAEKKKEGDDDEAAEKDELAIEFEVVNRMGKEDPRVAEV